MSKISVVVPVYKVEKYLRQCLDSIVDQTYRDLEIILVDDGSPDNCGIICDEYAERDERIQVIHKENGGLSKARNDGMDVATGEWIMFIDSDDWWDTDYLEKMIGTLGDQQPDVFCAGGWYKESGGVSAEIVQTVQEPFLIEKQNQMRALSWRMVLREVHVDGLVPNQWFNAPWDKLYRFTFLREYRIRFCPELKAGEDTFFNFQLFSRACKVIGCMCVGYHYRQLHSSNVHRFNPNKLKDHQILFNKIYSVYLRENEQDRVPVEMIYELVIRYVGGSLKLCTLHSDNPASVKEKRRQYYGMRECSVVKAAVRSKGNQYLSKNEIALKYLLRQPWFWPVQLCWIIYIKSKDWVGRKKK